MRERRFVTTENVSVQDPPPEPRPLRAIFEDIVDHLAEIVRSQIDLARVEAREELKELKAGAIAVLIGNMILLLGVGFLLLGLVYALSTIWSPWLAAVVVGGALALIGGVILGSGIGKLKRPRLK